MVDIVENDYDAYMEDAYVESLLKEVADLKVENKTLKKIISQIHMVLQND